MFFDRQHGQAIQNQPCPAPAEELSCSRRELVFEGVERAERIIDRLGEASLRCATTVRREAVPEKSVTPRLPALLKIASFAARRICVVPARPKHRGVGEVDAPFCDLLSPPAVAQVVK